MKNTFTKFICLVPLLFLVMALTSSTGFSQNLQISGGNNFSAAVCDNQEVFVWGANASGQLAIDATDAPIAASYSGVPLGVTRGNIDNTAGGLTYGTLPAISQVDAGSGAHVLGLSCAGQVWAWGDNSQGQLGRNSLTNSPVPQRVLRGAQAAVVSVNDPNGIFLNNIFYVSGGNNSSFALEKTTGRVLSWGQNASGELGDNSSTQRLTPVYVVKSAADGGGQLTNITQIEGGDDCTYALDASGNVWSWGDNTGNKLGRLPTATAIVPTASRVIQGDPLNNGYSTTPTPTVYLSGVIQISGGDTHCLCLDGNGNVWSFGGDWGSGQLGRGGGSVYQDDARKVAIPGLTTYATATNQFLGNGVDGKAVYVAAGQASSAVVMANGTVVTFGSRGLYNAGATPTASGTSIACPTPAGDMIMSGTLGDGNAGCNSTVCSGKASATQWSETPVYVTVAGGGKLTNITQVSDGDAWYYALSNTGSAYVWGWNRRGELGLGAGDYTDRCFAVPFTLPTGCTFSNPCPKQPVLPANFSSCPIFSAKLDPQVPKLYSSYQYNWQYRPTAGSGTWSDVVGTTSGTLKQTIVTSKDSLTKTVTQLGEWRVLISDNRTTVPFLCGPCPVLKDSITISPIPNPYTFGGCIGATSSKYAVTAPATSKIKWYTSYTGGSALNPLDSNTSITVLNSSATASSACGGNLALYADDIGSTAGTLFPTGSLTPTTAQIATAVGCATGSWTTTAGTDSYLSFTVAKSVNLSSVSVYFNNTTTNPVSIATGSVNIYNNKPAFLWNGTYNVDTYNATSEVAGSPVAFTAGPMPAGTSLVKSISLTGITLAPGTYWISVKGDYNTQPYFNCTPPLVAAYPGNWTTPVWDNTGNTIKAIAAISPAISSGYSSKGSIFDLKFTTGTGYSCGRILVCQSSTACPLPVELMAFNANKESNYVQLDWSTATEKNSSYYDVQRSTDGIHFQSIGKVQAAGNSSSIHQYYFKDENASAPGVIYYKLVEHDIDGKTTDSDIRSIRNSSANDVTVVPNPSNGNFTVLVEGNDYKTISLLVYNTLGQVVYQASGNSNEGSTYSKNIDIQNLAAGVYILHVSSSGQTWTKKIIKE
jgi:alpha-tubulin suppressor-like RCC1 family protein